MAGRISGYPQAALGLGGLALTLLFSARFVAWYFVNAARMRADQGDPFAALAALWHAARWPLLGMAVFGAGWLWALISSLQILSEAKRAEPPRLPPTLPRTPPTGLGNPFPPPPMDAPQHE